MKPLAYSYIRFSNSEQASGNSLERQTELAKAYADKKGLDLDEKLTMRDLGISGYYGKNLSNGALGVFLKAVVEKKVPAGSFLLIEDVDRLSRLPVMEALDVFRTIINAGITVVTLKDQAEYTEEGLRGDWTRLMPVLVSMGRGHEESVTKSGRIRDGWKKVKEKAYSEAKTPHGANGPSWLNFIPAKDKDGIGMYEPDAVKVKAIKLIFELSISGKGMVAIASELRERGIPPFTGRGIGTWSGSSLQRLLSNRALLGEYQPYTYPVYAEQKKQDGKAKPVKAGPAIKDYYPAVLDEETFYKAQEALTSRRIHRTTRQPKDYNVWSGIIKCKLCGGALHLAKREHRYFVCYKTRLKDCNGKYVRFDLAEQLVREVLVKVDSMSLVGRSDVEFQKALMDAKIELSSHQRDIDYYTEVMSNPDTRSAAVAGLLAKAEGAIRLVEQHIEGLHSQIAKEQIIDRDEFLTRLDLTSPDGRQKANALLKQLKIQALVDANKFHIVQDGSPLFDLVGGKDFVKFIPHTQDQMNKMFIQDKPSISDVSSFYARKRGEAYPKPVLIDPNVKVPTIDNYEPGYVFDEEDEQNWLKGDHWEDDGGNATPVAPDVD